MAEITFENIVVKEPVDTINYDSLMISLETFESEITQFELSIEITAPSKVISCTNVVQAVKCICSLLGELETLKITDAIVKLEKACDNGQMVAYMPTYSNRKLDISEDDDNGDYVQVNIRQATQIEQLKRRCNELRDAVQQLLETYSNAFRVDFCVKTPEFISNPVPISNVNDSVLVHLMCLHRTPPDWTYDNYRLGAHIYHGTRFVGDPVVVECSNEITGYYRRLKFDSWLNFEAIPISSLPRESRLVLLLYGCTAETTNNVPGKFEKTFLGWSAIQFFDFQR